MKKLQAIGRNIIPRLIGGNKIYLASSPRGMHDTPAENQFDMDNLKDHKFNCVRRHFCTDHWVNDMDGFQNRLTRLVQEAYDKGIYFILDWCKDTTGSVQRLPGMPADKQQWIEMWVDIGTYFQDIGLTNIGLAFNNEPNNFGGIDHRTYWWPYLIDCSRAVRGAGVDTLIIAPIMNYATEGGIAVDNPLSNYGITNYAYDMHFYRRYQFKTQGYGNTITEVDRWMRDNRINQIWQSDQALLVGEFNAYQNLSKIDEDEYKEELQWLQSALQVMNREKLSWCGWCWWVGIDFPMLQYDKELGAPPSGTYPWGDWETLTRAGQIIVNNIPKEPNGGVAMKVTITNNMGVTAKIVKRIITEQELATLEDGQTVEVTLADLDNIELKPVT